VWGEGLIVQKRGNNGQPHGKKPKGKSKVLIYQKSRLFLIKSGMVKREIEGSENHLKEVGGKNKKN